MGKGKRKREAKKSGKQYSGLGQHKQTGKLLQPPLLSIPNLKPSSWIDDRLPEMLWCALLVTHLPRAIALTVFRRVAKLTEGKFEPGTPIDVGHSGLAELAPELAGAIIEVVCAAPGAATVLRPLLLLDELPLRDRWAQAIQAQPNTDDWDVLRVAVAHVFDHQSQEATDCRWLRVLVMLISGQLKLPTMEMIRQIAYYPDEGDQTEVRPFIRASEISFANAPGSTARAWSARFWDHCWRATACIPVRTHPSEEPADSGTTLRQIDAVATALGGHFLTTAGTTTVDAKHEAVFGIATYGLFVLRELLGIGRSTDILARLGLRALLEMRITLAYLERRNSSTLWAEYRTYGLGQTKLAFLKVDDAAAQNVGFVNAEELNAIANEDRSAEFVSINLGHWDGSNLRKMSEQAGVKADYDTFYPWTSAFIHANWGAVRSSCFDLCLNALHRAHRVLRANPPRLNDVMSDACVLVDLLLATVDRAYPPFPDRVRVLPAESEV